MGIGPFTTYTPPGVITRTVTEAAVGQLLAGLRIPVLIGEGRESLSQSDFELIRGSSSQADTPIFGEDASGRWVLSGSDTNPTLGDTDGGKVKFRVRNYPVVDGAGVGRVSYDVTTVTVMVNGSTVPVASLDGLNGMVTLVAPPAVDDFVTISYYFHRGDTRIVDDVSTQVTTDPATLVAPLAEPYTVVSGSTGFVVSADDTATGTSITLATGSGRSAASVANDINAAAVSGLTATVHVDNQGLNHLMLVAQGNILIGAGSANGALGFSPSTYSNRNKQFRVFNGPVVDGSNGGTTTTDPSKVVVKVNGTQVVARTLDGANRLVTLTAAPKPGATVTVEYWFNSWQDTFDYLPNSHVTLPGNVGIGPGRRDYLNGPDFVIVNDGDQSRIMWGSSYAVSAGETVTGSASFDSTQILGMLVDNRVYGVALDRFADPATSSISSTKFVLPLTPTTGNGRDTPLGVSIYNAVTNGRIDLPTDNPNLVIAYVGKTWRDALARGVVTVVEVDGVANTITLKDPIPADSNVYATFWYNVLADDTYTLESLTGGPSGVGTYSVTSQLLGTALFGAKFGTKSGLAETVQWPSGTETVPDAIFYGGTPIPETVTVTFLDALEPDTNASVTTPGRSPYDLYTASSQFGGVVVDGNADFSVDLSSAYAAVLASTSVETTVTLPAGAFLGLEIDGVTIEIDLTGVAGFPTCLISDVVTQINAVIDADAQVHDDGSGTFASTAANGLAAYGPYASDALLYIYGRNIQSPTNGLTSQVKIVVPTTSGAVDASTALGFVANTESLGSYDALNHPAQVIGTNAGSFAIVAGLSDLLVLNVDGIDFSVTLPAGSSVSTAAVAAAINSAYGDTVALVGNGLYADELVLVSLVNTVSSAVVIRSSSTALTVLGLSAGSVSRVQPTAANLASALNWDGAFSTLAVAWPVTAAGLGQYLRIDSLTAGSSSNLSFVSVSDTALMPDTGIGIVPGTTGDNGEDARAGFEVTSSNPAGSAGTGQVGQTYTDEVTGLRFSILPASAGDYSDGGSFTLIVSQTFVCDASIPIRAVPGLETTVMNTMGVISGTTAILNTYARTGAQPRVGDVYYVSYQYEKSDISTQLFQNLKTVQGNFGPPTPEFPLSLAARLCTLNGAVLVGLKQVLKAPGAGSASVASYLTAIDELRKPITGSIKPDVIVPLNTDPVIDAYLNQHCVYMSTPRQEGERVGVVGTAVGTSPTGVAAIARGLQSELMMVVYPDSFVVTIQDSNGNNQDRLVDGSYMAAALAGSMTSPSIDVATPITRRHVVGFTRIGRVLDPTEANQVAVSGVTVMETADTGIRVRHGLTTRMESVLTRTPSVTLTIHYVQQTVRTTLDPFIGTKFLSSTARQVERQLGGAFQSLISAQIVSQLLGVSASADSADPTILRTESVYVPVFPLEYIVATMNVRVNGGT